MKKSILSLGLILALGAASSIFAADNTITETATIQGGTVVSTSDASGETLDGSVKMLGVDIDYGVLKQGDAPSQTLPLFVKTNNEGGVSISIADNSALGNGHLAPTLTSATPLPVSYSLLGDAYDISAHPDVTLTTSTNDGSTSVGDFVMSLSAISATQEADTYTTTLDVTVTQL